MKPIEKICSVCRKIGKPPIQWWEKPYNACSDCIRKAALDIQNEHKVDEYLYEKHKREEKPEREFNDIQEDKV